MIKLHIFWLTFFVLSSFGALMTGDQIASCFSGLYAVVFVIALIFSPREADQ